MDRTRGGRGSRDRTELPDHDLVGQLRRVAERIEPPGGEFLPLHPYAPWPRHTRSWHGRRRDVPPVPPAGGLLVVPLVMILLLSMMSGSPGLLFLFFPIFFFAAPIFLFRRARRWHAELAPPDEPRLEAPPVDEADPHEERLIRVCDRLLALLERSPESVRAFLTRPRETIEALRRTGLELVAREQELRETISPEETDRLSGERAGLAARIGAEPDPIARRRLEAALRALDHQREQHEAIRRSANRLDAEQMRLIYTLEGLHAQLQRLRSAGPTEPGTSEAIRRSVASLRDELGALAEALEEVDDVAGGMAPLLPIGGRPPEPDRPSPD